MVTRVWPMCVGSLGHHSLMARRKPAAPPEPLRAAAVDPASEFRWRHRLPRRGPVDRLEALADAARGKRVVHVGFVDELLEQKRAEGVWLHERIAEVATALVGLDSSAEGVARAREHGHEAHVVDAQSSESVAALGLEPAEVVIAGEIVEHLDAPGPFLRAMRDLAAPDGLLVLTTPNAYRLLNFVAPLSGSELVHPDHTAWHSPQTLRTLLGRSGWRVEDMAYYRTPSRRGALVGNVLRGGLAALNRLRPYWSDGLIVWAKPSS
jgi:2-polyprenyl-3-methyl-5-hydroxy-6-metoxy-1,4-benzoquinol methylase